MNEKKKALIILFILAIFCVAGAVVYRKSSHSDVQEKNSISDAQEKDSIPDTQEKSSTPNAQEKDSIPDAQEKSSTPDVQEKSSTSDTQKKNNNSDAQENYEDSSKIVQLILTGDMDIDMYKQDELQYYYHPNNEDYQKDGPHIRFHYAGKLGDQDIVIVYFDKESYTIKLSSNQNQISQIGILDEQNLQTLSDFSLEKGDVVEISYSPEKSEVRYNNNKISFEDDDHSLSHIIP